MLDQLKERDVTVLVSTHDLNMASTRFDKVLLINHHLIAYGRPELVFTPENVRSAFGSRVLHMDNGAMIVDECCPGGYEDHFP